jgi:predicted RNA binding protein YcfA (HicA-like mRNA interferase family)
MSEKLPRLTSKEVEAILSTNGFVLLGQKGSHRKWWSTARRSIVVVPEHRGKALPVGTLAQIIRASGIPRLRWKN